MKERPAPRLAGEPLRKRALTVSAAVSDAYMPGLQAISAAFEEMSLWLAVQQRSQAPGGHSLCP